MFFCSCVYLDVKEEPQPHLISLVPQIIDHDDVKLAAKAFHLLPSDR